jgi:iron complex outermembrane receptor protein
LLNRWNGRCGAAALLAILIGLPSLAHAQRTAENAVAEAEDAFGSAVGNEVIGLYTAASARGFSPTQAGNLRINGMYYDQAAGLNQRLVRGSSTHVGISAQGYPFPAPTGVVDYDLRTPGDKAVASVVLTHGAIFSYDRYLAEVDVQAPVVKDVLSVGAGATFQHNNAHTVAVGDRNINGALIGHYTPNDDLAVTAFWGGLKTEAVDGDRPRVFIGDNPPPRFRPEDMTSPTWLFFGFRQFSWGAVGSYDFGDQWLLEAGAFRSVNNTPRVYTGFVLNLDSTGTGDYAIEQLPPRYTRSTSGEARLSKTVIEHERRHKFLAMVRGRDRDLTFGGGDLRRFGRVTLGAIPVPVEPAYVTGATTTTETRQVTGGVGYEGIWLDVGQLSMALQKTDYERTLTRPGGLPVTGADSPWLANVAGAAYLSKTLAVYAGYTRGLEEVGTAPGNATNRDEAVPAQRTRQVDAGIRYQFRPNLQLVMGAFIIDKPYFGLDRANVFRDLGDVRHRGVEVSFAGPVSRELTVVAGVAALRARITNAAAVGGASRLIPVGPVPHLVRVNLQYRPEAVRGLALDAKLESISSQYLTASNSRKVGGAVTLDAGIRYTMPLSGVPVRFSLRGFNLTNTFSVTPNASGQIAPFESRRVELSVAADF